MGSDSPQRILHAGPDRIRETFGVRHPSFELAPSRCALERVPRIDTKYPANERHHDRSLPATGPGGSASRGDSGAALSPSRKKESTTSRLPRTATAQMPTVRPSGQAGDHGSIATTAAARQIV